MAETSGLIRISSANHHDRLIGGLWDCFLSNRGVDYLIESPGGPVRAHRLVLDSFLSTEKLGSSVSTLTANDPRDCTNLLDPLLEFAYTGQATVPRELLDRLLELAHGTDFDILVDAVVGATVNTDVHNSFDVKKRTGEPKDCVDAPVDLARRGRGFTAATSFNAEPETDEEEAETSIGVEESDLGSCLQVQLLVQGREESNCDPSDAEDDDNFRYGDRRRCSQLPRELASERTMPERQKNAVTVLPERVQSRAVTGTAPSGSSPAAKTHKCEICDRAFAKVSQLVIHSHTHTGFKPYECPVCAKRFAYRNNLATHSRSHRSDMPFSCVICAKTFPDKRSLRIHGRSHSRKKPFRCECGKAFAARNNLEAHSRIHTGEKPFICVVCHKAFAQLNNLTRHERIHAVKNN